MTDQPLISIVITSYNNYNFIGKCLSCATSQDYRPIEIIVVDQYSSDGTPQLIQEQFANIKLIQNDHNTGFADGMNQGICASAGEYVLLLNSDLFLDRAFIRQAVNEFKSISKDRVGMLASIVYRYQGEKYTKEIDSIGYFLLPYNAVINSENISVREWVLGPAGSAMFLSRTMLEDIRLPAGDYLDSTYFCYGEDIELAFRAQLLGWRCLYAPIVAGWHIGSASVDMQGQYSKKPFHLRIHATKNRYLTLLSCFPLRLLVWSLPWNILAECGLIAVDTMNGRLDSLKCLFRAYRAVFKMLPAVLAKRRWLMVRRKVSCTYLRSLYAKLSFIRTFQSLVQKI